MPLTTWANVHYEDAMKLADKNPSLTINDPMIAFDIYKDTAMIIYNELIHDNYVLKADE